MNRITAKVKRSRMRHDEPFNQGAKCKRKERRQFLHDSQDHDFRKKSYKISNKQLYNRILEK